MSIIPWRNKKGATELAEREFEPTLQRFRFELDRMFDQFFSEPPGTWPEAFPGLRGWRPSLDLSETDKQVIVRAEMPGGEPEDIGITISGNLLTISGEKREDREERGQSVYRAERRFGSFRRSVALPDSVDTDSISAEYDRGLLTVHLAKSEKAVARRIPVSLKKK
ncbi:MAG: Hsp20/alpha crystallin family protein [Gemmatimonadota bacterium]|nr:MAG: Hsp20/alpha crystallin family protein [Gemmatimonadota bacterium]